MRLTNALLLCSLPLLSAAPTSSSSNDARGLLDPVLDIIGLVPILGITPTPKALRSHGLIVNHRRFGW
jgi:hypothetical protein